MRPMTRWTTAGLLALAGTGCALPGGEGSITRFPVVDGVPQRTAPIVKRKSAAERMRPRPTAVASVDDDIAADFLHALAQIDGYAPEQASVRFTRPSLDADPLIAALERRMRSSGYAVRVVADANAPGSVAHEVRADGETDAAVHTLSFGGVQMRRSYRTDARGALTSAGSLFVRGADASDIRMDRPLGSGATAVPQPREPARAPVPKTVPTPPDRLADAGGAAARESSARASETPLGIDRTSGKPIWSGLASTLVNQPEPSRSALRTASRGAARRTTRTLPENLFELGGSNFANAFGDYTDVEEVILIFPNDSLVLGEDNKARIRRVLDDFDAASDSFSVVGCSLGKTNVAHGNEALALGRANRVKEELLFAGIPRENIFEEGCWATEAAAKFPSRGVVLTHKRRGDA